MRNRKKNKEQHYATLFFPALLADDDCLDGYLVSITIVIIIFIENNINEILNNIIDMSTILNFSLQLTTNLANIDDTNNAKHTFPKIYLVTLKNFLIIKTSPSLLLIIFFIHSYNIYLKYKTFTNLWSMDKFSIPQEHRNYAFVIPIIKLISANKLYIKIIIGDDSNISKIKI